MKWWIGAMSLSLVLMFAAKPAAQAQPGVSVSFQTFYDDLSPHGQWMNDPQYGYVWAPSGVGSDFRPYYSGGQWAMTDYGNTWVSDYSWGWAPFHYGRWTYDPYYGWIWIPGYQWGPAWVSWRNGGGNYGWAPMGPGISVSMTFGSGYYVPNDWWVFVPQQHIYSPRFHSYYRGPRYNNTYINNTTIINNTYINNNVTYASGPRRSQVERATGQRVNVYNVQNNNRPGRSQIRNNSVSMYRPNVSQGSVRSAAPRNAIAPQRPITQRPQAISSGSGSRGGQLNNTRPNTGSERSNSQVERPQMQERPQSRQRQQMQERNNQLQERPQSRQRPQIQQREQPQQRPQMQERRQPQQRPQMQQREQPQQRPQMQERRQPQQRPQMQQREQPQQRPQMQERRQPQQRPQMQSRPQSQPQQRPQMQSRPQSQPRPQMQAPQRSNSGGGTNRPGSRR